jgi:hypothetical protein
MLIILVCCQYRRLFTVGLAGFGSHGYYRTISASTCSLVQIMLSNQLKCLLELNEKLACCVYLAGCSIILYGQDLLCGIVAFKYLIFYLGKDMKSYRS